MGTEPTEGRTRTRPFYKSWWGIALIVLAAVIVIGAVVGEPTLEVDEEDPETEPAPDPDPETELPEDLDTDS